MPNLTSSSVAAAHVHDVTPIATSAAHDATVIITASLDIETVIGAKHAEESLTITDTISSARRTFERGVSESLQMQDTSPVTRFKRANKTPSESFTIEDAVNMSFSIGRQISESFNIEALVSKSAKTFQEISDSFTIVANGVGERITFKPRFVSESLAISEDGFAEICKTVGQLKEIIIHQLGRFFSILPQRNVRAYSFESDFIKHKEKEQL